MIKELKESESKKFNLRNENGKYISVKDVVLDIQEDEEYFEESVVEICKKLLKSSPNNVFSIFASDGMEDEDSYDQFVNSVIMNGRSKVKSMEDMYGGEFTLCKNSAGDMWVENYPEGAGSPDLWIPEKMLKKYTN